MNAMSCFAHASSTPCFSGPRRRRLYSFCTLTNRAQPLSARIRADSSIISAEKLLQPISRTLPAAHERVERAERLLERRRLVGEVQLVEVDAIGAEPAQRVVARPGDVRRARATLALVVDRAAELGGDQRFVAPTGEGPAEELLAERSAVDVGGVEQRDARVERGVDDRLRRGLVDPAAEVVAAETDDRRVEGTDGTSLHGPSMAQRPTVRQPSRARAISWAVA